MIKIAAGSFTIFRSIFLYFESFTKFLSTVATCASSELSPVQIHKLAKNELTETFCCLSTKRLAFRSFCQKALSNTWLTSSKGVFQLKPVQLLLLPKLQGESPASAQLIHHDLLPGQSLSLFILSHLTS